ncbi:MAG: hypothetical protein IAF08_13150 [Rhizobacter sp.]|nr:hypothetical protein [Chlorobiales bacterium]
MKTSPTDYFDALPHDPRDPDPWLALYLDSSVPIDRLAKAAMLKDSRSWSRQFMLPLVRPLARLAIILIQVLKVFIPNYFTSSFVLHRILYHGMKTFLSPNANFLILRHFTMGSQILAFIAANVKDVDVPLRPLLPKDLEMVKDDLFLNHDLNLFNFIINLNRELHRKGLKLAPPDRIDFEPVSTVPLRLEAMPTRWTNFVDLQSAIEIFTPVYQLFLTDNDFWRASNSLQLDETIGIYIATLLQNPHQMFLVNNKHPIVPLITLNAAYRLMLHGLSAESLHALLCELKAKQSKPDGDQQGDPHIDSVDVTAVAAQV